MQKSLLIIFLVFGILVLGSYGLIVQDVYKKNNSDAYWLMSPKQRVPFYFFAIQAMAGFLIVMTHYLKKRNRPNTGLLKHGRVLEYVVAGILIFSMLWSIFVYLSVNRQKAHYRALCSFSLIAVAIFSILLLAGIFEDTDSSPFVRGGVLYFATVAVLVDCVGWNAVFIQNAKKN